MQEKEQLLRVLGLAFGVAAVVGAVVGQGILRSPGEIAQASGSPALIISLWIGGGLVALVSAFAFAELGTSIPRAGGIFAYIYRAIGPRAGLFGAFALIFAYLSTNAVLAFVTGEYLVRLGVGGGEVSAVALGIGVTALFALLNAMGTRATGGSQIVFSALKGAALVALVIALFASPGGTVQPAVEVPLLRNGWLPMATAMLLVISTYNGWSDLVFYGEEITDPARQIPRALFGGIIGVSALYILVNLAMLHVMTPDQMAGSDLVAADAAGMVLGERGDFALTLFGVLSVGAIGNLGLMTNTRMVFAAARAGILPKFLSIVDRRGTPMGAMLFSSVAASALILTGSYNSLQSMSVTAFQLTITMGVLSALALRRREPDLPRPFKIPFYPWPVIFAAVLNAALIVVFVVQDPWYSLIGMIAITALWAFYAFVLKRVGTLETTESPGITS